nr:MULTISPECIES: NUDIX domain-containing protein [Streptomyces]
MDELVERVDERDRVQGVVSRREAVQRGWLHRIATTVCRDEQGRFLVHQRAEHMSRFPGQFEAAVGGAVGVGEPYEQAASRELGEEMGVRAPARFLFKFLSRGGLSPHWLGVHEVVVRASVNPAPREVAWYGWLTESELRRSLREWRFTSDSRELCDRYFAFRAGRE